MKILPPIVAQFYPRESLCKQTWMHITWRYFLFWPKWFEKIFEYVSLFIPLYKKNLQEKPLDFLFG